MIREQLQGKRVLLTGATGFLGTAVLERLFGDIDVDRVDVVIRGDAQQRLAWLLSGSAFGPARERMGSTRFDELAKTKLRAVPADLAKQAPDVADDIDLVIHCAATVEFDPPINEAFAINLEGTRRLFEAAAGKQFVHVSTAYVAGRTKGVQREEQLTRKVDWEAEAAAAAVLPAQVDAASRRSELLDRFEKQAGSERGRAGPIATAQRAEELRREWVTKQLVKAGQSRARSLGWPEVYSFSKALTEMALDDLAGDQPLAIVRPSIIESSLRHPYPGWIEGFRMIDPVVLGFGRGLIPEFIGNPDSVIDLIPVDLVVNVILAVAASPPERRGVYHACSGSSNPMTMREIYELTREYFLEHPLPEPRGAYRVPEWKFPGRGAVEKRLGRAERLVDVADKWVRKIPRSKLSRQSARTVDRYKRRLDFARRMADLYGAYTEGEVVYTDDGAKALFESLDESDRSDFRYDPDSFTWRTYLHDVHLPMLTAPLQWVAPRPPDPSVSLKPATNGEVLAVFDIEGTIVDSNVVEAYLYLRMSELSTDGRIKQAAALARRLPGYLKSEGKDRGQFLRQFYRQYEGIRGGDARRLAAENMDGLVLRRTSAAAVRRIRRHREAGHRIVFVTGSLDFIVNPIAPLADELIAAQLAEVSGLFTGELVSPPLVGEGRAAWLAGYARDRGADLEGSYAYADSISDLPLLEAVGNPVAVNPDLTLTRIARGRKWPIEEWEADRGSPRIMLPEPVG